MRPKRSLLVVLVGLCGSSVTNTQLTTLVLNFGGSHFAFDLVPRVAPAKFLPRLISGVSGVRFGEEQGGESCQ